MNSIKVYFCDMYKDFNKEENLFVDILRKQYDEVVLTEQPDFLFYGPFGIDHHKFNNCVKIFYTGEAIFPNFNECDYAIAFDRMEFGDRYLRRPIWLDEEYPVRDNLDDERLLERKFCNFVYSNDTKGEGAKIRKAFAKKLMKYKHVDCPGRVLNNMHEAAGDRLLDWRKNKVSFISQYKFTIAFENSAYDGYTTEKMTQPLSAHSVPIYWGNPSVTLDFNEDAFINANGYESRLDELVEWVIDVDSNPQKYLQYVHANPMSDTYVNNEMERLEDYILHIAAKGNRPICKDPLDFARRMSVDNLSRKEKIKYFLLKRK